MMQRARSQLHLQLGQEVIYVLMALGILTTLILLANAERLRIPLPICALPGHTGCAELTLESARLPPSPPECALPGRGPCYGPRDLPPCMQSGVCYSQEDVPCMRSERGCMPAVPNCLQSDKGPCISLQEPQKPPILNLTEREGFRFAFNSYVISKDFRAKLRNDIVPEILKLGDKHDARVVEVVGYTDSVPVSQDRKSSLDQKLNVYLSGDKTLSGEKAVEFADNVGLGMMRAASVVRALKEMPDLKNQGFIFLAISAGQTIGPYDRPVGSESGQVVGDEKRRRVEIRLRRSLHETDQGQEDQGKTDQ